MSKITYYRGDQYPLLVTVKNSSNGQPVDITGYSFLMTVNPVKNPADASQQLFQVAGVLDADPETGRVTFDITSTHTDNEVKTYYYDIQMTTPGGDIRTIVKDAFIITMDITKS